MTTRPCIDCGELTTTTRCTDCAPPVSRPSRAAGYDRAWDRLSLSARRLQPFCSDCGTTEDLTADHSPEAWRRRNRGLAIRLSDVDVVCRRCNSRRGAARKTRGGNPRRLPLGAAPQAKFQNENGFQQGGGR